MSNFGSFKGVGVRYAKTDMKNSCQKSNFAIEKVTFLTIGDKRQAKKLASDLDDKVGDVFEDALDWLQTFIVLYIKTIKI